VQTGLHLGGEAVEHALKVVTVCHIPKATPGMCTQVVYVRA
jgi:hypothetical protein